MALANLFIHMILSTTDNITASVHEPWALSCEINHWLSVHLRLGDSFLRFTPLDPRCPVNQEGYIL